MPKITIVGAGGYVFPLTLIRDILAFESLQESVLCLYDPAADRVAITADGARRLIELHHLGATVEVPQSRREALAGADFVICTFQVGGIEAYAHDVNIPREFGVDQPVGDTLGPGGIFRGLRSIGALMAIASDMSELCPDALLIQYANPMSMNCWATSALGVHTVGLCHSVQHTSRMLAKELEVPYEEITFDSAGVNHTAWFTTFRRGAEDLLPRLRETMIARHLQKRDGGALATDDLYAGGNERVRTEIMRLTGYFHTESSHHASEYWPWFRTSAELVAEHISARWDYYDICSAHSPDHNLDEFVQRSSVEGLHPSEEYGAYIIDSMTTGARRVIYGNVVNDGLIDNLPGDCCVEVACVVDALGLRPVRYGELPAPCAALNTVQVNVQRLGVQAALRADKALIYAAVALDPLAGALLTLPKLREMTDRMLSAERPWLEYLDQPHFTVGGAGAMSFHDFGHADER